MCYATQGFRHNFQCQVFLQWTYKEKAKQNARAIFHGYRSWQQKLTERIPHPVGTNARMEANTSLILRLVKTTATIKPAKTIKSAMLLTRRRNNWKCTMALGFKPKTCTIKQYYQWSTEAKHNLVTDKKFYIVHTKRRTSRPPSTAQDIQYTCRDNEFTTIMLII